MYILNLDYECNGCSCNLFNYFCFYLHGVNGYVTRWMNFYLLRTCMHRWTMYTCLKKWVSSFLFFFFLWMCKGWMLITIGSILLYVRRHFIYGEMNEYPIILKLSLGNDYVLIVSAISFLVE